MWPTFGGQDTVPRLCERHLEKHPHLFFVINEQNGRHPLSHHFSGLLAD